MNAGTFGVGFSETIKYMTFFKVSPRFLRPNFRGSSVMECLALDSLIMLR